MKLLLYEDLLNSVTDGIYFIDLEQRITCWNKAAERLSGFTAAEVVGTRCSDNVLRHVDENGKKLCIEGCPLAASMTNGDVHQADVYMHHKFGHRVPISVRSMPMRNDAGDIIGAVEVFKSNRKETNIIKEMEKLRQEALTDQLTGIGNRRYADINLKNLDETIRCCTVSFGVLFVDIDHFKHVNDTWGHHLGDKVLTVVAKTITGALRPLDVACRWGGEEFLLLIPNTDPKTLGILAERVRMLIENSWLDHEGKRIRVTASVGGAISGPGDKALAVVAKADAQMYRAKEAGRNRVRIAGLDED